MYDFSGQAQLLPLPEKIKVRDIWCGCIDIRFSSSMHHSLLRSLYLYDTFVEKFQLISFSVLSFSAHPGFIYICPNLNKTAFIIFLQILFACLPHTHYAPRNYVILFAFSRLRLPTLTVRYTNTNFRSPVFGERKCGVSPTNSEQSLSFIFIW